MCVAAGSGVLVSLKYLLTSYHTSKVIVHGRPGLTPRYRESQYVYDCPANASAAPVNDLENMITPDTGTGRQTSSQPLVDTLWGMENNSLGNNASTSRNSVSPRGHAVSQLASAGMPSPKSESALVQPKRLCRSPSDLESMAPAELLYDPQVAFLDNLGPFEFGPCVLGCAVSKRDCCELLHGATLRRALFKLVAMHADSFIGFA